MASLKPAPQGVSNPENSLLSVMRASPLSTPSTETVLRIPDSVVIAEGRVRQHWREERGVCLHRVAYRDGRLRSAAVFGREL